MSNTPRIPQVVYRNAKEKTTFAELTTQNEDAGTKSSKQLNEMPFSQGVWIRNLTATFGSNTIVQHGLQRQWQGYIITRIHGWVPASGTPALQDNGYFGDARDNSIISLGPFANFTFDIWIF